MKVQEIYRYAGGSRLAILHGLLALPQCGRIAGVHVAADSKVPADSRDHQGEPEQQCCPEHGTPVPRFPFLIAQSPQGDIGMQDITDKEWYEQGADYLLL